MREKPDDLPEGDYDYYKIAEMIEGLYRRHKKGWTLSSLMNECDLSAADVMRLTPEAARQFVVLRRAYPDGKIPDPFPEVRVEVTERKPNIPDNEIIALHVSSDSDGKVWGECRVPCLR